MSVSFAVVIPVGSDVSDIDRLQRLVRSIMNNEPRVRWIVLVDDCPQNRRLEREIDTVPRCDVVSVENPRRGGGLGYYGGLFTGVMHGLNWIWNHTDAAYSLKLDTDSLIIRPFSDVIENTLVSNPDIGQLGVIGRTCNRADPTFGCESSETSPLVEMARQWEHLVDAVGGNVDLIESSKSGNHLKWYGNFSHVYALIRGAEARGYHNLSYCQGGAYALSRTMLSLLAEYGCFDEALQWSNIPIGEDVIMGMHTTYSGMRTCDLSHDGDPFGLHWKGLPFSPPVIVEREYSIIHSMKNDPDYSERELYSFFREPLHRFLIS